MANSYTSLKRIFAVKEGGMKGRPSITSTSKAREFFRQYWQENSPGDQECFVVACLDTKHKPISVIVITIGTLDASLIHPREVFRAAILEGSSSIMISHNHPSGDVTPSEEDRMVTDKMTEVGTILGIQVLDHIIYGDGSGETYSFQEGS